MSGIVEKNLSKYEKIMKNRTIPPEIQLKKLHDEKVNEKIINLIPSKNVTEMNSIINQISTSTGYTKDRVMEAILKSDTKKVIIDEQKGHYFVKRNVY
jgi:predicted house-cleaning noncanonical NTP pyrophosphatase (MazG superfamily)